MLKGMKRFTKLFGVLLAFALMFTTTGVKAQDPVPFEYLTIRGTSTKLKKYLIVDKDANIPGVTFTYTVSAGTAVAAANGKLPVYAGPDAGSITVTPVTFTAGEAATEAIAQEADSSLTDKIGAKKDITIDFTPAHLDRPGVFRYIITETANIEAGVVNDPEPIRTIDVYVEDNNGSLQVAGYVAYEGTFTAAPAQSYTPNGAAADGYANGDPDGSGDADKSNKYVNKYITNELTVEKDITGNQGDKESKWEMTVKFDTLPTGYNVKYAKVEENGEAFDNPTYSDFTDGGTITLGYKDKYDFKGIPEGVTYTVTETKANQDGYTTTYTDETATFADDDTAETKEAKVENKREGVLPTGVAAAATTGLVIAGVGLAGLLLTRKRKEEDED